MNTNIYDLHEKAFEQVSAFVILKDGERVATVAIKFPRDGAGRLYAYVNWIGNEMVRGHANGYGYDKRSAAVARAAHNWAKAEKASVAAIGEGPRPDRDSLKYAFWSACSADDGRDWSRAVEDAGFTVLQVV
jgi:hypothetical protein